MKFHIDKAGNPAPCSASVKACPLGGEHYENMRDAMKATVTQEIDLKLAATQTTPRAQWHRAQATNSLDGVDEAVVWKEYVKDLEKDPRGAGLAVFAPDIESMSLVQAQDVAKAQQKPMKLTPTQSRTADNVCAAHGVSRQDVEDYVMTGASDITLNVKGIDVDFHPQRHVWLSGGGFFGKDGGYGFHAESAAQWKEEALRLKHDKAMVQSIEAIANDRDPNHYYGALLKNGTTDWSSRDAQGLAAVQVGRFKRDGFGNVIDTLAPRHKDGTLPRIKGPTKHTGPDPEFIEALRKMYMAKFGTKPEDDGVDAGQLLAMFNKGELE